MKAQSPARERWLRLGRAEQLRIAGAIARRRARTLRQRYSNVTGVGAGLRSRRGRVQQAAVCLLFTVASGQKKRWQGGRGSIPKGVRITATRRGRRVQFDIPTDVLDLTAIS